MGSAGCHGSRYSAALAGMPREQPDGMGPDDQRTRPVAVPQVVASQSQGADAGSVLALESVVGKDLWPAATEMGSAPPAACESRTFSESRTANPHVRFDERDAETELGSAIEAPETQRAGNG